MRYRAVEKTPNMIKNKTDDCELNFKNLFFSFLN